MITTPRKYFTLALSLIGLVAISIPALASPEKAQELRGIFDRMIERSKSDSATLKYTGDTSVEDAGSYYAVTMPHASFETGTDVIDIGIFAINASPHTEAGQWKMSIATPTPIVARDKKNGEMIKLHIGAQKAAGLWDDARNTFLKFLGEYNDIRIEDNAGELDATVSKVHISNNLTIDDNAGLRGKSLMKVDNILFNTANKTANETTKIQLDSAHLSAELRGVNRVGIKNSIAEIAQLTQSKDKVKQDQITKIVTDIIGHVGDGMSGRYQIDGLNVIENKAGEEQDSLSVRTAHYAFDMNGFQQDKAALGFTFGYEMETPPADEPLAPTFMALDLKLSNLPLKQLIAMTSNTLGNSADNPEMAQFARMGLLLKVPALLGQNSSQITLSKNKFGNDLYEIMIDGKLRADANALKSAIGNINLAVHGYDNLTREADKIAASNPAQANNIRSKLSWLDRYISYAEISTDAKGRTLHRFNIQLDANGLITINGQDISKAPGDITIEPAQ